MEKILILDLGGRSARVLCSAVRECKVYSEILPADTPIEEIKNGGYKGVIIAGEETDKIDSEIFSLSLPVLAVGYGANVFVKALGGECIENELEKGVYPLALDNTCVMLSSVPQKTPCYMSHRLYINRVPTGFRITARTEKSAVAAMENSNAGLYALQFEAESLKSEAGVIMLKNFLYKACSCHAEWTAAAFLRKTTASIGLAVEGHRVMCVLTGRENEETAARLLYKSVGSSLSCLFIDSSLLKKGESERIRAEFSALCGNNFYYADAAQRFKGKLIGITDNAGKERICREEFSRVFEEECEKLPSFSYLADPATQGEERLGFKGSFTAVIEPLRMLLPEELSPISEALGGKDENYSSSFAALALAVEGEVTDEKIALVREADSIFSKAVNTEAKTKAELSRDGKTVFLSAFKDGKRTEIPFSVLKSAATEIKKLSIEKVAFEI